MRDLLLCLVLLLAALMLVRSLGQQLTATTSKPAVVDVGKVRL